MRLGKQVIVRLHINFHLNQIDVNNNKKRHPNIFSNLFIYIYFNIYFKKLLRFIYQTILSNLIFVVNIANILLCKNAK